MTGAMDGSDIDDELLRVDSGGFCRVWDEARVPVLYPGTLTGAGRPLRREGLIRLRVVV